jgi:decaprenylphospho-beta-D-ribofuranose 2-oxidase
VLTVGDHARASEITKGDPLRVAAPGKLIVPFQLPELTLNRLSIRAVNQVILNVLKHAPSLNHYDGFFYPLDSVREWNRGYGRRGFIQYQFVIPFDDGERVMRGLLETIVSSDQLPFLNILKRFGPANEAPLSFPASGYTFAIDFPVRDGLEDLTRRLDDMVADAGGRIYLGKDSFLAADTFRRMYPATSAFLETKRRWDPEGLFTSDLGRRLELSR